MHLENLAKAIVERRHSPAVRDNLEDLRRHLEEIADERVACADHIEMARAQANDDLEIDDHPFVSPTEAGVWVSAWIWVPKPTGENQ